MANPWQLLLLFYEIRGSDLDVLQLLFLRYLQGCVKSCHHLLTQTGINCCVLNFSCFAPCSCRPVASVYLCLKRNLGNSFSFCWFPLIFFVRCGNLRSLRLVYLVITLSVMLLDCWYLNAKYADYLRDCYNQFLWLLLFSLNWSIWLLFNVIIAWFVMIYSTGFSSHTILFFVEFLPGILPLFSYLLPTVTTSRCDCWFLSEFPICNAKCLCYFQF